MREKQLDKFKSPRVSINVAKKEERGKEFVGANF